MESRGTLGRGKGVFLGCFLKICAAIKDKRRETPTKEAGANEKKNENQARIWTVALRKTYREGTLAKC